MRRHYAFESEELPSAVKDQLEKVEDVVDEKCTSVEACDKMLDKISAEQDKFNGCLKDMTSAAKDCQDGKCDTAEMAAKVSPKMAELKEVAKSIGVASEGETVSEAEVQAAKQYLEGAEEIVEAKKDELSGDSKKDGESKKDDSKDDDDECEDGECDDAEAAEDAYLSVPGFESYTGTTTIDFVSACESMAAESWIAMEGYNWDKRKEYNAKRDEIKALVKQAKQAAKAGNVNEAKSKMDKAVSDLEAFKKDFVKECNANQSVGSAILGYFAYGWRGFGLMLLAALPTFGLGAYVVSLKHGIEFWVDIIQAIAKYSKGEESMSPADFNMYTKSMEHNMDIMIGHYKNMAKKIVAKANKKAGGGAAADSEGAGDESAASEAFTNFIEACESFMIGGQTKKNSVPYLFD